MTYIDDALVAFESLNHHERICFFPGRMRRADMDAFAERIREGRVDPLAVLVNAEIARRRTALNRQCMEILAQRQPMPVLPKSRRVRPTLRMLS